MPHEDAEPSRTPAPNQCTPAVGQHGGYEAREALISGLIAPILDTAPNKKEQVKYSKHGCFYWRVKRGLGEALYPKVQNKS